MTTTYGHKREMEGFKQALSILNEYGKSKPRVWLEYGWSMARVWVCYAAVLLLMMVVGVNSVWGQTDYSGIYYIANKIWNGNNTSSPNYLYNSSSPEYNWYLVPAGNPQQSNSEDAFYSSDYASTNGDSEKPFLTTFRTNRDFNSIWIFKKTGSKYYLIHALTGKYIKYEPPVSNNPERRSVHLEDVDTDTPGNVFQYTITTYTKDGITGFNIKPTQSTGSIVNGYLNPAGDNWPYYYAHLKHKSGYWCTGIVGWYNSQDGGSLWPWEDAKSAIEPTINVNVESGTFTISIPLVSYIDTDGTTIITKPAGFLPSGCSIRYTTGDGTQDAPTATIGEEYSVGTTIEITDFTNVKAVVVGYGMVLSQIANTTVKCTPPTISYDNVSTVTMTPTTEGSTIYYTTDENGTPSTLYESPISVTNGQTIKAIAKKDGCVDSEVITYIVRQECATPVIAVTYNNDGTATVGITTGTDGATIHYTTDGTDPNENSTSYPGIFANPVTTGMTIKAISVKENYNNSGVAEATVVQVATPAISIVSNEITITCATEGATIYYKVDDGEFTEYTGALGLSDNVSGHVITAYATKSGYMVKSANAVATASETKLTLPTPTIEVLATPNGENKNIIFSTSPTIAGVTYKYTLDGTDPSESNGTEASSILLGAPAIVKVIAIHPNYVTSDVTSSTSYVIPTNMPLLIQSQANAWNSTDFHFYMIPGDEANSIIKVNTTSLFRTTMEWHFENAGIENDVQYYYIVNNANSKYLCYDGTNGVYMDDFSANDKFKFSIVESATAGTFLIKPFGQNNNLNKDSNNSSNKVINLNSSNTSENVRWKFILPSLLDKDAPFTVSVPASDSYSYYKIANVGGSGHYIVPGAPNATTSNSSDANVMKSGVWYFEQAQAANASDWCTYYYIRNAETREFLYFTKDANNAGACLATSSTITEGSENRYMFTWAKTADANVNYYIIPKLLKDASQNQFSSLRKHDSNTSILTNVTRGAGKFAWTFETALFCEAPAFKEKEIGGVNKIEISCITAGAEIYYTTDGSEPTSSSTHYSGEITSPSGSDQMIIRAIAVVSDANLTPSSASSEISTLLYNPDITLDPTYDYGYNGTAKEPPVTVSVGEVTAPTTAYTIVYTGDNIHVGTNTATATINDVSGDNWYILGSNLFVTFSITLPTITITVSIDDWTYGATASTPSVSGNPEGTDNDITFEYKIKEAANNTYSSTIPTDAGDYTIKATLPEDPQGFYGQSVATADFTINKATLTVTGKGSKNYGDPEPASIPYDVEGLVTGDEASDVLTGSLARKAGENTGTYAINQGTLALSGNAKSANYTLVFAGGTFRIIGTDITVTLNLNGWTYGDDANVPSIEVTSPTDYPTSTASVTYYYKKKNEGNDKYAKEVPIDAGTYNVKAVIAPKASYEGAEKVKEFTISKATLTVTADNKTKGYRDDDPKLTYTVSGLKYTDIEQVVLTACELQRAAGETLGNYDITKTSHTLGSSNYNVSFVMGTFTITNKLLGDTETHAPTTGISIYAKKNEDSWTVKVYQGETELIAGTEYTFNSDDDVEEVDAVNGTYTLKINSADGGNYDGYALTTYQDCGSDFKPISDDEGSKKMMPFYTTEQDLSTSKDLVPCIVGQVNPSIGTISIVPISYIPKDVPVLLLASSDVTGITASPKNAATPDISESVINSNKLKKASTSGVYVETTEAYMYYKATGEFVLTIAGTMYNAFYIINPNYTPSGGGPSGIRRYLRIVVEEDEDPTGMDNELRATDNGQGNDLWYTLDGRRLDGKPTQKGIYITNGKKMYFK